jgi:hypothetical protein
MTTKRIWAATAAVLACSTLSGGHVLGQAAQVFFQAVDDGEAPTAPGASWASGFCKALARVRAR